MERQLTADQRELAMVIKQTELDRMTAFQEYWKKRCGNPDFLTPIETYNVLMQYAMDVFDKEDFCNIKDSMRFHLIYNKSLTIDNINKMILSAIWGMWMRKEDNNI
jgi:hypothetical protein